MLIQINGSYFKLVFIQVDTEAMETGCLAANMDSMDPKTYLLQQESLFYVL